MAHVAVTAVGLDRPGIVAGTTEVLARLGCNLEDTSMTILRGHFAMMLIVDVPEEIGPSQLEAELGAATAALHLDVTVRSIDESEPPAEDGDPWTVAVYGADRPGIVHAISEVLASAGVNITDLSTRVIGSAEHPVYAMHLDVLVPGRVDRQVLEAQLHDRAAHLGVEVSMHPVAADLL